MTRFYMMVTNDSFTLPLCPPMSAKELAEKLGMNIDTVRYYGTPSGMKKIAQRKRFNKEFTIVSVELEEG